MDHGSPAEHWRCFGPKTAALLDRPEVERVLSVTRALGLRSLREWDRLPQVERDLRLEEYDRERGKCPDCGNPIADCSDPMRRWYPYRRICYATMEREAAQAALNELRKDLKWHDGSFLRWSDERSKRFSVPAGAGETVGVADHDIAPWDEFGTRLDASPLPSEPTGSRGVESDDEHDG